MDVYMRDVFPVMADAFNTIGLVSAVLVILITLVLGVYDYKLINRVGLRLQAGVALVDIMKHSLQYHIRDNANHGKCALIGLMINLGDQMYYMLNIVLVLNLQLMILHGWFPTVRWEIGYWLMAVTVPLVITSVPLAMDMFGSNKMGLCFLRSDNPSANHMNLFLVNGMVSLTLIYCLVVPCLVLYRLHYRPHAFDKLKRYLKVQSSESIIIFKANLKRIVTRSSLYPLACCLTLMGQFVVFLMQDGFGISNNYLRTFGMTGKCLAGFFNLLAFLCDPSIIAGLTKLVRREPEEWFQPSSNCQEYKVSIEEITLREDPLKSIENSLAEFSEDDKLLQDYLSYV